MTSPVNFKSHHQIHFITEGDRQANGTLDFLQQAGILTPENEKAVFVDNIANLDTLSEGIETLHDARILTQENFDALLSNNGLHAEGIARSIVRLHLLGMLTPENRQALLERGGARAALICMTLITSVASPSIKNAFQVRPDDLRFHPQEVLQRWIQLPRPPSTIEFLTNANEAQPGVDGGGPSAQFYTELTENLLKEGVVFSSVDEKTGMPRNANFDLHGKTISQIGTLLTHMYKRSLISGRILPDEFFALLAIVKNENDSLSMQRKIVEILQIGPTPLMQAWLDGDASKKEEVLKAFRDIEMDPKLDFSDEDLHKKTNEWIQEAVDPYLKIARAFLSGISDSLEADLHPETAIAISAQLQGNPVAPQALIASFRMNSNNPVVLEKFEWIKERINLEHQMEGSTWILRFFFCITAQKALKIGDFVDIYESMDERCTAYTCVKRLNIPANPSTKEEFFERLDQLMADDTFSMA